MLVTLKEILQIAEEKNIAVGSFNTPNLTSLTAILSAAEELDQVFGEYVASLGATDLRSAVAADYLHVEALMTASRIIREAGGDPAQELGREWDDASGEDAAYAMLRRAEEKHRV